MQSAYISKLMELAQQDKNVLHILSDSGTAYDELFKRNFPEQIINFGICEEHKVAAAAGLAACGKIPFLFTSGAFLAYRALEFIRNDICFQKLNVKIIGMGSGLSWSTLGPSHHTTEDIGILRTIPNLTILSPATPVQLASCVEEAYHVQGPVYIRMGMSKEKEFFSETKEPFFLDYNILKKGKEVAIITTGSILEEVYAATELLEQVGIQAKLIHIPKIKPFPVENIVKQMSEIKLIITVEEHNIYGGIGSILSEIIAEKALPIKMKRIGLHDTFAVGYGTISTIRKQNGLDAETIALKIKEMLEKS